jgi:hypothetical protein
MIIEQSNVPVIVDATIFEVDFMGMTLRNIPDTAKKEAGIENGVLVVSTDRKSLISSHTDVSGGYVLSEIDGKKINSLKDVDTFKKQKGETKIKKITFINRKGEAERYIFGN